VQVDPSKPKLKPPGSTRLKLNCDILLSTSPFKINLRRYTAEEPEAEPEVEAEAVVEAEAEAEAEAAGDESLAPTPAPDEEPEE